MNLVSLIAVMPNFFSATQDMLMAIKSFIEGTCIYMEKGHDLFFWGISMLCISTML